MNFKQTGIVATICSAILLLFYYIRSSQITSDKSMQFMKVSTTDYNFQIDLSADKYKNMEKAVSKNNQQKLIKTLSKDKESSQREIELVTESYTIHIDGKENMVVFAIGNHNEQDFELPMLSHASLTPIVYKLSSEKRVTTQYKQLFVTDIHSISQVTDAIETAIRNDGIRIDTVFMDLQDNEWDVMKELVPRFCLMIRQYIIRTAPFLSPAFQNVREMKELYRSHGYTYSRIGNSPTIRVFMKE